MRLIIYNRAKLEQEVKNLKILEVESSEINNNNVNYYLEYNEIPVVKYSDTGETFVVKDFNSKFLKSINDISDIYISDEDLQPFGGSGSGGGNDLNSVLQAGNYSTGYDLTLGITNSSYNTYSTLKEAGGLEVGYKDNNNNQTEQAILTPGNIRFFTYGSLGNYRADITMPNPIPYGNQSITYRLPSKGNGTYTLATLDDISGGGSQNLQQTLENGTSASFDGGDNTADILTTLSGARKRVTFVTGTSGFGTSQFSIHDQLAILSNNTGSNLGGSFSVANGLSKIQQDNGSVGTTVQFNTPTSASVLNFPAPNVAGDYVLATEDKISLQKIIDNNAFASKESNRKRISIFDATGTLADPEMFRVWTENSSSKRAAFDLEPTSISIQTIDTSGTGNLSSIFISESQMSFSISLPNLGNTTVSFENPVAASNTQLKYPSKSGSGTYTLAVKEDVVKFTANVTFDGTSTVYNIPHTLGSAINFADAIRGAGTNFDVYNVTWTSSNVVLTYQNPPTAGTQTFNVKVER